MLKCGNKNLMVRESLLKFFRGMSLKVARLLRRLHLINLSNIYAILKKKDHSESCIDGLLIVSMKICLVIFWKVKKHQDNTLKNWKINCQLLKYVLY